jgi:S1-C subfamily serine protease
MKYSNNMRARNFLILLIFILGLWGGHILTPSAGQRVQPAAAIRTDYVSAAPLAAAQSTVMASDTIKKIVDKTGDSVVRIEIVSKNARQGYDPFFERYFGDGQDVSGLGSGLIISKDGYILTNYHVVENAQQIRVYLTTSKDPVEAVQVGVSKELDLAILKISVGQDLPFLVLGNSDNVYVGDWVIAIGNPYGLDHTVTVGVISAKSRPVTIDNQTYENLLQTDASINPGNSGGPLLNLQGEVIGVNTAINQDAQGIGFAIPSSTIQQNLQILLDGGKKIPWLGVSMREIDREVANYLGLIGTEGILVNAVFAGSPAEKAGIRAGDVILDMNGQAFSKSADMQNAIRAQKIGDQVTIRILRDNKTLTVTAVLEGTQG